MIGKREAHAGLKCGFSVGLAVALAAVLTACGSDSALFTEQDAVKQVLSADARNTFSHPQLRVAMTSEVEIGDNILGTTSGSGYIDPMTGSATATTVFTNIAKVRVIVLRDAFLQSRSGQRKTGRTWTEMKLSEVARSEPDALPDMVSPGLDPLELPELAFGLECSNCILSAAPVFVTGSKSATSSTPYSVTLSLHHLLAALSRRGSAFQGAASELGRVESVLGLSVVDLGIVIEHDQVRKVSVSLPVYVPRDLQPLPGSRRKRPGVTLPAVSGAVYANIDETFADSSEGMPLELPPTSDISS